MVPVAIVGGRAMTEREQQRLVNHRLAVIRHVGEVTGNVAQTCRYFGISRQIFYEWLRRYEEKGVEGLRDRSRRPHSPNATSAEVVGKIIYLRQNYHFGPGKIAMYLKRYHKPTAPRPPTVPDTTKSPCARSPADGPPGCSHEAFGVRCVVRRPGGGLDQAEFHRLFGTGELHHCRDGRNRLDGELDRATDARRDIPRMGDGVDNGEVDHRGAGQAAERRGMGGLEHPGGVPQLQHPIEGLLGKGRQVAVVGNRAHGFVQRHEVCSGYEPRPEQLILDRVGGQPPNRPWIAVAGEFQLRVVERSHYAPQFAHRIRQRFQLVQCTLSVVVGR